VDRSRLFFIRALQRPACRLEFLLLLLHLLYHTPRRIIILLYCGWHLSLVLTYFAEGGEAGAGGTECVIHALRHRPTPLLLLW
jgi:hypothetical protein